MIDFGLFENPTFLGSVFAMVGYGAAAQVMVVYLPLFLQNAYGFDPTQAGLAMLPFALPMVLVPRLTSRLAVGFSGRTTLTAGLIVTFVGNMLFWVIARRDLGYTSFVVSMLIAGAGAGVLNGETVKVLSGSVPPERAGMASGLASTTRFIGILFGVAGLGAVLSNVAWSSFVTAASSIGLDSETSKAAAKRVVSGDLARMLGSVPEGIRNQVHSAALSSFAGGFAAANLLAAAAALLAAAITWKFVGAAETRAPRTVVKRERPCMVVDCRHPI
jgi:Na+/melibiose symporter-like transporter